MSNDGCDSAPRGRDIGAVSWLNDRAIGVFQYMPEFVQSTMELSPIMMPLRPDPYEFPGLPSEAFKGLPGMLADKFRNPTGDFHEIARCP